jgi:hypothetical protein
LLEGRGLQVVEIDSSAGFLGFPDCMAEREGFSAAIENKG